MALYISNMRWLHKLQSDTTSGQEVLTHAKEPTLQMQVADDNGNSRWVDVFVVYEEKKHGG